MERTEIKILIEKMGPGTVLTLTGAAWKTTVCKSPRGVLGIGEIEFSAPQAATWVKSFYPYSVVNYTDFHSVQTALSKSNPSPKRSNIHLFNHSKTRAESEV